MSSDSSLPRYLMAEIERMVEEKYGELEPAKRRRLVELEASKAVREAKQRMAFEAARDIACCAERDYGQEVAAMRDWVAEFGRGGRSPLFPGDKLVEQATGQRFRRRTVGLRVGLRGFCAKRENCADVLRVIDEFADAAGGWVRVRDLFPELRRRFGWEHTGVFSDQTLGHMLGGLRKKGLVEREEERERGKRPVLYRLTAEGLAFVAGHPAKEDS